MMLTQFQKVLRITQLCREPDKNAPKAPNKYSFDTVIKYYEHILVYFILTSVSKISILTISKATQVSKEAGLNNLSGRFLKDWAKFLAKPINDLCNLSINSEKFPNFCKVAKLN